MASLFWQEKDWFSHFGLGSFWRFNGQYSASITIKDKMSYRTKYLAFLGRGYASIPGSPFSVFCSFLSWLKKIFTSLQASPVTIINPEEQK
jgi:ABC-type transport system involved in cytochrome c biogenesis permease subunit